MNWPFLTKIPNPYAESKWRWRSHAPQRALNASGSVMGSGAPGSPSGSHGSSHSRLRMRTSRQASQSLVLSARSETRAPVKTLLRRIAEDY